MNSGLRRSGGRRGLAVLLCALGVLACSASGTVVVKKTFAQLCAAADTILCGSVGQVESRRDPATGVIHTYYTIEDIEWIAGAPNERPAPTEYVVRVLGGVADGESMIVHGMPRLVARGRYVLFLRGNGHHACPLVGWHQGCFHVAGDGGGTGGVFDYRGRPAVAVDGGRLVRGVRARAGVGHPDDGDQEGQAAGSGQPMTLDEFIAQILAARQPADTGSGAGE